MALKSYRELQVWQKAINLVEQVYKISASFPREERYGLTSQLRRAAVSVPSNIAEGNARRSTMDYARFISIALGSLAEVETQVEIAGRLGYLDTDNKPNCCINSRRQTATLPGIAAFPRRVLDFSILT